ncbi:MAG: class I SAM-dependent methyltransferase [Rhizomicrobium sp.]
MTAGILAKETHVASAAVDTCPVCRAPGSLPFLSVDGRRYGRCETCAARFLDPCQLPSRDAEYAHYLHHENHPDDPGYRRFLSKLAVPLLRRLPSASRGLDYGCGPGPALAVMLREAGHEMALYDPFFHPNQEPLEEIYDFVTCTEAAEHFHRPADEFGRLMALVRPGGWLAIMTCFQTDDARFQDWHYRKDPTHVVFYREETLRHLAAARGWHCEVPVKDVALMQRPSDRGGMK